jgi:hypothetical protein
MPSLPRAEDLLGPLPASGWAVWNHPRVAHVHGRHELRSLDLATNKSPPQKVMCCCTHCGATWQTLCDTGRVREHISRFAFIHSACRPKQ